MTQAHPESSRLTIDLLLVLLTAVAAIGVALAASACGSSATSTTASPASVTTVITKVMPRDAAVEPPWNGRYVQVNVRTADAGAMDPGDWRVFVNGKEPELEKGPSVLPFSATGAVVGFMVAAPYDPGRYEFRVVYAPKGRPKVEKSWEYRW
jgi:hypothetical protein